MRFPEFAGEWEKNNLSKFSSKITKKNKGNVIQNVLCNSANLGIIPQNDYFDRDIANADNTDSYYIIEQGDFVYNPRKSTAAPYGPVNIYNGEKPGIISPLYLCFSVLNISSIFLFYRFKSSVWHPYVYSHGDTGVRFDRVSIKDDVFFDMPIYTPTQNEQEKIATLLSLIDERIATQNKIIEDLKKLKSAIRIKAFKQLENSCEHWTEIGNMLQYEQPSKYLVSSTEYSDGYAIPVLTANKAFILGYTDENFGIYDKGECVIFDDFTMDVKFVNFPFKVKSSAIKILTSIGSNDLYFVYEYLQNLGLVSEEHKRHYISEIEPMNIACPPLEDQQKISNLLCSFNNKIECANRELFLYNQQKQYLLTQMFI